MTRPPMLKVARAVMAAATIMAIASNDASFASFTAMLVAKDGVPTKSIGVDMAWEDFAGCLEKFGKRRLRKRSATM